MTIPKYYPTPEETAECLRCGHRANINDFWVDRKEDNGSECPQCGCVDDTPPRLDEEDIARDTAACAEAIVLTEGERDWLNRPYDEFSALVLATVVRGLALEVERLTTMMAALINVPFESPERHQAMDVIGYYVTDKADEAAEKGK